MRLIASSGIILVVLLVLSLSSASDPTVDIEKHQSSSSFSLVLKLCVEIAWWLYLMSSTADSFFSPALQSIVETFEISPAIAGITFLSFGNGAPDVCANLAAFSSGKPRIGVAGILGGGLFVSTIVAAGAGWASKDQCIQVNTNNLARDVGFYLISVSYLCYAFYDGAVDFIEALGFLGIYVLYVLVVAVTNVCSNNRQNSLVNHRPSSLPEEEAALVNEPVRFRPRVLSAPSSSSTFFSPDSNEDGRTGGNLEFPPPLPLHRSVSAETVAGKESSRVLRLMTATFGPTAKRWTRQYHHLDSIPEVFAPSSSEEDDDDGDYGTFESLREKTVKTHLFQKFYAGLSYYILTPIAVTATFVRRLSIPLLDADTWNFYFALANPPFAILLTLVSVFDFKLWDWQLWAISSLVGSVGTLAVAKTAKVNTPPTGWAVAPYLALAFVMSMIWIMTIADQLLVALEALGNELGLSQSILGATILAWGNSAGDLVSNYAIAKDGFPTMAFAGCFAGPMFNLLVGLGLSMSIYTYRHDSSIQIGSASNLVFVDFVFLFTSLSFNLIFPALCRLQYSKRVCVALVGIYLAFIITTVIVL